MLQPPPVPLNPIEGCSYSHPSLQGSPVLHMYRAVDYPEDIKNLITQDSFSGWAERRKESRWINKGARPFQVDPTGWIWAAGLGSDGVQWFWKYSPDDPNEGWYTFTKVQGSHGSGCWMEPAAPVRGLVLTSPPMVL